MKTLFITSFHPLISRNILATPILDLLLRAGDIRIVVLVPQQKAFFFEDEFRRPGVIIEGVERRLTRLDAIFRYLFLALLATRSIVIKRKTELESSGQWLTYLIGGSGFWRRTIRRVDRWLTPRDRFRALIARYRPDLVFATDVQNESDVRLMHEARGWGIPVVGMVRSWDNLTSKGIIRVLPDLLLVNNELVKREAVTLDDMPEGRIEVVGIPHYDFYVTEPRASREEFFRRIGADPAKRLILFTPTGDRYLRENIVDREILELLRDEAPQDSQFLLRYPPQDTVNLEGFVNDGRVLFDRATTHGFSPRNTELTREADRHLADTLAHSVLVVSGPSTISIDAAVFDRPVILTAFDGKRIRPYYESVRRYFDYEHQQPIIASGGVQLCRGVDEFRQALAAYLKDPAKDHDGRERMVREQCWHMDGRSSQRVCEALLAFLQPS